MADTKISDLATLATADVADLIPVVDVSDTTMASSGTDKKATLTVLRTLMSATSQPLDAELTALAGLTSAADKLPYFTGSGTAALADFTTAGRALIDDASASAQRTTLGLGTAAVASTGDFDASGAAAAAQAASQPLDTELTALAGLTSAADKLPYFTGSGTAALADLSSFARTLIDDANAAAMIVTLGLASIYQPLDAELTALAGLTSAADKLPYFSGSGTAALADFTAAGRALVDDADAAAQRTTLGLGTTAVTAPDGSTIEISTSTLRVKDAGITYAKIQNISATSRIAGRKTAGAGTVEECTLSEVLDFVGSPAQGDILYRGASTWERLGAGTNGYYLQTQGAGANPQWAAASGGSSALTGKQQLDSAW